MVDFSRVDEENIEKFAAAFDRPDAIINVNRFPYEMIPAQEVGDRFKSGWRPMSPMIAMVPPEFLDDEKRSIATAAAALGQK